MNNEDLLKDILEKVEIYSKNKTENKKWIAGKDTINYAGNYFDHNEDVAAVKTLLKGWLVFGNDCQRFENIFPRQFNKYFGILTNSGSSANLLMMTALTSKRGYNLPKGTKVLTPVAGFPTTINPILQVGFEPVFCDIELDTLNLDLDHAEKLLEEHKDIKVLIFAHVLGNPPDMNRVMELVKKYDLILLEDCCDALGSTYEGKPLGSFGEMCSTSFYPAHHMTMGEGGFVSCNTKDQEIILTSFREWGRGCYCVGPVANKLKCGTCKNRFGNWLNNFPEEIVDHKYTYEEIGYNLKPIEIQGSWGLQQIKKLSEIHSLRKRNYQLMYDIYSKYEEFFILPKATINSEPSWFAFPLTVKSSAPFSRTEFIDYLEDNLIQTRPYFAGNILLHNGYNHLEASKEYFLNASYTNFNTFFHGVSPIITEEQIKYIKEVVDDYMNNLI